MCLTKKGGNVIFRENIWLQNTLRNILNLDLQNFMKVIISSRFAFDPRRVQYSSLILTGQLSREDALTKLKEPVYSKDELKQDKVYL